MTDTNPAKEAASGLEKVPNTPDTPPPVTFKVFPENISPGKPVAVRIEEKHSSSTMGGAHKYYAISVPIIKLHCEICGGERYFDPENSGIRLANKIENDFVVFTCRNCGKMLKSYAIRSMVDKDNAWATVIKYGEVPGFGPPTPAKLITLLGSEKDYFLKGRRCENQGLGIAAFAYYRRIIEAKRNNIFEQVLRVSEIMGASKELIEELKAAQKETQFSTAIESIKHAIPDVLLIKGHNPLTMLHGALSEGLHAKTDEECLEIATSIRIVLTELVKNFAHALKDETEINQAVSRLLNHKSQKTKKSDANE